MRRGWKIVIAVLAVLVVLVGLNAVVTGKETKSAEVTVPGGKLLDLNGGTVQAVEEGPKNGSPIVLIHCFTCAIDWWDGMIPRLAREHRVVAVDLLGHGGSEKPDSGYSIPNQADLVAEALGRLGVRDATVVGHSLGGPVAVALAEQSPRLVNRLVIIDSRSSAEEEGDLGFTARLAFAPVIGETLWRVKPDFAIRRGLEVAFAPGFDVPDAFVDDVARMTYSAYEDSPAAYDDYASEESLADRIARTGKPLMVIMGAEEQIIDNPRAVLDAYAAAVPTVVTNLIRGVGHSPNVEEPDLTANLVLGFDEARHGVASPPPRAPVQDDVQNRDRVRKAS